MFSENSKDSFAYKELERLTKANMLDPLLKIGNRRYAETMFDVQQSEMKMTGRHFGVIFMDIDHFKSVNDKYGHAVGDKVLLMISRTVANLLRQIDSFIRWGGDEFLDRYRQGDERRDFVPRLLSGGPHPPAPSPLLEKGGWNVRSR